uniref:Uncharacterized protein n=1 Tax=Bursaphelenchus xylophilus TaxID=6326 RepID=A0A1I7SGX9_BURXY
MSPQSAAKPGRNSNRGISLPNVFLVFFSKIFVQCTLLEQNMEESGSDLPNLSSLDMTLGSGGYQFLQSREVYGGFTKEFLVNNDRNENDFIWIFMCNMYTYSD